MIDEGLLACLPYCHKRWSNMGGTGGLSSQIATDDWKERKSIRERWEDSSRGNSYLGVFLAIQEIWWLLANEMGWLFRSCVADIH